MRQPCSSVGSLLVSSVLAGMPLVVMAGLGMGALGAFAQTPNRQNSSLQNATYTVQTVALGNYQEALETAASLRDLEFDAYVDFAMFEGRQFARVRVGCFLDRPSAEAQAEFLRGNVTAEAVAVEAETPAPSGVCLRREVGFALPEVWAEHSSSPETVAYRVEVGGEDAYLVFGAAGWEIAQDAAEAERLMLAQREANPTRLASRLRFQALNRQGGPVLALESDFGTLRVARAQLLWQASGAAVVLEGAAVVAYHATDRGSGYMPETRVQEGAP